MFFFRMNGPEIRLRVRALVTFVSCSASYEFPSCIFRILSVNGFSYQAASFLSDKHIQRQENYIPEAILSQKQSAETTTNPEKKNKQKAKSNRGISRPLLHAKQLLIHANARSNKSLCNNKQANRLFLLASSWRKVSRVTSLATRTSLGRTCMLRVDGGAEIRTGV